MSTAKKDLIQQSISNNITIKCFSTKNTKLLEQYFEVRRQVVKNGGHRFKGSLKNGDLDIYDNPDNENTHLIVAMDGKKCVGGARVVIKDHDGANLLPSETPEFLYEKVMPELELRYKIYAELSRLIILPEYKRQIGVLYNRIRGFCIYKGIDYLIGVTTKEKCRIYRMIANNYPSKMTIKEHIEVPKIYEGDNRYISVLDLAPEYENENNGDVFASAEIIDFARYRSIA